MTWTTTGLAYSGYFRGRDDDGKPAILGISPIYPALAPCTWTEDEDAGAYDTACGNKHLFIEGTPAENGYRFCPYCGGALVDAAEAVQSPAPAGEKRLEEK